LTKLTRARHVVRKLFKTAKDTAYTRPFESYDAKLGRLEHKVDMLAYFSHGGRATYIGDNRVLVRVVVANHNIAYLVEANDKLISPWFIITGTYETELTNFFVRELKPDSRCIDAGSNFGYFTCLMARLCPAGKVVGIEADQRIYELLRDNIAINGFERHATAVHAAVSNSEDFLTLYRRQTRSGNTSVIQHDPLYIAAMGEPPSDSFDVRGLPIDDLAAQLDDRVDFIKIDIEGAEPLALRGSTQVIKANPNLQIVMEWSPGQIESAGFDLRETIATINDLGLRTYTILADGVRLIAPDQLLHLPYCAGILLRREGFTRQPHAS
jgi:FkbM family methyltransferase